MISVLWAMQGNKSSLTLLNGIISQLKQRPVVSSVTRMNG